MKIADGLVTCIIDFCIREASLKEKEEHRFYIGIVNNTKQINQFLNSLVYNLLSELRLLY